MNITNIDYVLNWMLEHRFNVVRIPVSVAWSLSPEDAKPKQEYVGKELKGKTIFEIVETVIDGAARRGMMVMLDMHTLVELDPSDLWVSGRAKPVVD